MIFGFLVIIDIFSGSNLRVFLIPSSFFEIHYRSQLRNAVWLPFCIRKLLWKVLKTKVKIDFFAKMTRKHNNKQFFKKYSYKLPTKAWYLSFTTGRSRLSAILHPKTPSNGTKNESQNWLFCKNDQKTQQQAIFQKLQLKTTNTSLISVVHN